MITGLRKLKSGTDVRGRALGDDAPLTGAVAAASRSAAARAKGMGVRPSEWRREWSRRQGAPRKYWVEAKVSIWRRRSHPAPHTTLPTTMVVREATVGPELRTRPVSARGK